MMTPQVLRGHLFKNSALYGPTVLIYTWDHSRQPVSCHLLKRQSNKSEIPSQHTKPREYAYCHLMGDVSKQNQYPLAALLDGIMRGDQPTSTGQSLRKPWVAWWWSMSI
jgi:hypothetical protein